MVIRGELGLVPPPRGVHRPSSGEDHRSPAARLGVMELDSITGFESGQAKALYRMQDSNVLGGFPGEQWRKL